MKKILLFAIATCLLKSSFAQLTKGNTIFGGNIAFTHSKSETIQYGIVSGTELYATVNFGYFLLSKFAVGVRPGIDVSRYRFRDENNPRRISIDKTFITGPFFRYYILAAEKKLNLFADADILVNLSSNNINSFQKKTLLSSLGAGLVVFVTDDVGIEGLLSYSQFAYINYDYERVSNLLQFKGGVQVYFRKAK